MHGRNKQLQEGTAPVKASRSQATGTGQGDLSLANQFDPIMQMRIIYRKESKTGEKQEEMVDFLKQRHDLFPIFKNERWQRLLICYLTLESKNRLEAVRKEKQLGSKIKQDGGQTELLCAILQHASWLSYQQLAISQVNYLIKLSLNQNRGSFHS